MTPDPAAGPVTCDSCGGEPDDAVRARLTWTVGVERGRTVWTCVTAPAVPARHRGQAGLGLVGLTLGEWAGRNTHRAVAG